VVIAYDDSDGWYDHQAAPQVNASHSSLDALNAPGVCNGRDTLRGVSTARPVQGRCGYGPRLPLLVISPWSRANYVDHTLTDQSSVLRFIEDNWLDGQRIGKGSFDALAGTLNAMFDFGRKPAEKNRLLLDETTGQPVAAQR
jgi:phospholipase C